MLSLSWSFTSCFKSFQHLIGFSHQQPNSRIFRPETHDGLHFLVQKPATTSTTVLSSAGVVAKKKMEKVDKRVGFFHAGESCTESLGCESSDQVEEEEEGGGGGERYREEDRELRWSRSTVGSCWRKKSDRYRKREFPPPIPSLNQNGHPTFYLKSSRKDGRLRLAEVRINRPEILRASREDGRLTLHLIKPDQEPEPNQEPETVSEPEPEPKFESDAEEKEEQKWKLPVLAGESYRRCYVVNNRHYHHHYSHHHQISMWSSHNCVRPV